MLRSRKSMATILVMFCIGALTAFASIAQAHDGVWDSDHCGCERHQRHHGGHYYHHNFKKIAKKLGLTDAQQAQAKAIFQGNKDVVKPILTNLHAERKNLKELTHADKIDEAAIRAETAKIAGLKADFIINKAKVRAQFRAILTPAQLAILKTLHHEHGQCNHCSH